MLKKIRKSAATAISLTVVSLLPSNASAQVSATTSHTAPHAKFADTKSAGDIEKAKETSKKALSGSSLSPDELAFMKKEFPEVLNELPDFSAVKVTETSPAEQKITQGRATTVSSTTCPVGKVRTEVPRFGGAAGNWVVTETYVNYCSDGFLLKSLSDVSGRVVEKSMFVSAKFTDGRSHLINGFGGTFQAEYSIEQTFPFLGTQVSSLLLIDGNIIAPGYLTSKFRVEV